MGLTAAPSTQTAVRIAMIRWGDLGYMNNAVTLANFLVEAGLDITLFALGRQEFKQTSLSGRVNIVYVGTNLDGTSGTWNRLTQQLKVGLELKRELARSSFELAYIVHSWTLPSFLVATGGSLVWRAIPTVYHTFDWLEPELVGRWHLWLERAACMRAALVVNVDRSRARLQRTLYGLPQTPMWVPNYLSRNAQVTQRDEALRLALLGSAHTPADVLLVYPSVASDERMTLQLIEAFTHLPKNYCLATFFREGSYADACRAHVARFGLGRRVRLLDPVSYDRLIAIIACADIGAIFHDGEKSSGYFMANPDRLATYVAHSIPFVASDYPNMEAVVYRHGLGLCCNPHDPRAIANAIRNLVDGAPGLATRRRQVRAAFEEDLNFEAHAGGLLDRLRALTAR